MEAVVRIFTFLIVMSVYLTIGLFANAMFLFRYVIPAPFSSAIKILSGARSENITFLLDAVSRWSELVKGSFHILSGRHDDLDTAYASFSFTTNIIAILFFLTSIVYWILFYEISSIWELITTQNLIIYTACIFIFGFYYILFLPIVIYHWAVVIILVCIFVLPWMLLGSLGKILLQALLSAFGMTKSPDSNEVTRVAALPNRAIDYLLISFWLKQKTFNDPEDLNVFNGFKKIFLSLVMWSAVAGFAWLWHQGAIHDYRERFSNFAASYGIKLNTGQKSPAQRAGASSKTPYKVRVMTIQTASVRERPNKDSTVRQTIQPNRILAVFQQTGNWIEVGDKSPIGWINLIDIKIIE